MSETLTACASRSQSIGQYGAVSVTITLGSTSIEQGLLDQASSCIADQADAYLVERNPGIEGLSPKEPGETHYLYLMEDSDGENTVKIEVQLTLYFVVPRHIAYQLTSIVADVVMQHITQHFQDPDSSLAEQEMQVQADTPGFQLAVMLQNKTVSEVLVDGVDYCSVLTGVAETIEPTLVPKGLEQLMEFARVTPEGLEVDLGMTGDTVNTGMYL